MVNDLKKQLLENSNNGLDFFRIYFGADLQLSTPKRFGNIKSPFYNDNNGSFSIYQKENGRWYFHDHGNPYYLGDCFDFYAFVYKLDIQKDFPEILRRMEKVLQDGISQVAEMSSTNGLVDISDVSSVEVHKVPMSDRAKEFWKAFGITEGILRINRVMQINGYTTTFNDGTTKDTWQEDMVFAYDMDGYYKIYYPKTETREKKFFTYKCKGKREHIFGRRFQNQSDVLFLTGGEKDVMTLHSLGYQAICLGSENAQPSRRLAKDLFEEDVKVVVLYDNDDAGRDGAEKISKLYSWQIADISTIIEQGYEVKDISDYVKLGLPIEKLKSLLDQFEDCSSEETEEFQQTELQESCLEELNEVKQFNADYIPEFVYENLPQSLKEVVCKFDKTRRDLLLIGSLGVLSNIIRATGVYDHKVVYPNLFVFVSAPASTGKGDLIWAKRLGDAINKKFDKEYNSAYRSYLEDKKGESKPYKKRLFVSGNASYSALLQQLFVNGGEGVMFETEADTLNTALEKEWGNYSDVMRRVFEFEVISRLRKDEEECIDIENPRLSIVLTGTKDQLIKLIPTPENGLFSRFIFIDLPQTLVWRNPFESREDYGAYYSSLSEKFLKYYEHTRTTEFSFSLSDNQIPVFNKLHSDKQEHDNVMLGSQIIASVRRMGAIHFRLAMLLSTLRMLDEGKKLNNVLCSDTDFEVSTELVKFFAKHTEKIYSQLPKKIIEHPKLTTQIVQFYENLKDEFTSKDLISVGEQMGIAKSTYEAHVRKLIKIKRVERLKQGLYRKIQKDQ
ncbi:MAG: hypothetical protein DI539_07185 [Flavobacterium psychrophilum]|nr:MAG: hypothetical protein DI539_07185 [Flavobacterium psychrophilum]